MSVQDCDFSSQLNLVPVNEGWGGFLERKDFQVPFSDEYIMKKLGEKYPPSVFNEKWSKHRDGHYESGKSKCARSKPYLEFEIIKVEGKYEDDTLAAIYIQVKGLVICFEPKRSCWAGMGKFNILLSIQESGSLTKAAR